MAHAEPGGYGFNPQASGDGYGYGGLDMLGQLFGPGAGGGGQQAMLQKLMEIWSRQATTPEEYFSAKRQARDPVGWRAKQKDVASMGPTFDEAFAGRRAADLLSPEAILASQGSNAMNQWAQRGAMKGINTEDLARFNKQAAAGRGYKSYT